MRKLMMVLALGAALVLLAAAPALAQESGANDEAPVTVESGDTLSGIAAEVLGDPERWTALYEANRGRIGDSADLIYPGQVLRIPEVGRQANTGRQAAEPARTGSKSGSPASASERQADKAQREAEELVRAESELGSSASAPASASASAAPSREAPAAAPSDTTMSLTVPKMGIADIPVVEGTTEASLSAGAGHLSTTGYPWVPGSNTYIAGHRVGYPGTPSDRVFYDLPSLQVGDEVLLTDANGTTYTYAVSEIFAVSPSETYVTSPIAGRDVVTLQTCTESVDDWTTIGPGVMNSGPESGRLIVRADRVA